MPNRTKDTELSRYLVDEYPHDPSESVLSNGEGKRRNRWKEALSKMIEEIDWNTSIMNFDFVQCATA
jgi:hypothetical protein